MRVAGSQQVMVSFISLNSFTIYHNITTTNSYNFRLFRIYYVAGIMLSAHLILLIF